mgnify:CR=1 FL=1
MGRLELVREKVSLGTLLNEVQESLSPLFKNKGLEFGLVIKEGIPAEVVTDPHALTRIARNLLSNAAKFSPSGEQVMVSVRPVDGQVRIAVSDRGPGIPEDFRDKLFDKFTQADASTTRKYGGSGLGLAICKLIIDGHGGEIGVDSQKDEGSTFFFSIPA